jgi:hypothetical protein
MSLTGNTFFFGQNLENSHPLDNLNINIDNLLSDILQNTQDIETNRSNIENLENDILLNTADIASNLVKINSNTGLINTNTNNIASNLVKINTNTNNIASNLVKINTYTSNINSLTSRVYTVEQGRVLRCKLTCSNGVWSLLNNHGFRQFENTKYVYYYSEGHIKLLLSKYNGPQSIDFTK